MAKYTLNKKRPDEISERARRLNEQSITVNIHDHMMFEFAIRKALGQKDIFNTYYLPQLKRGCFNVVATTIGSNSPCLSNLTDDLVFGAMEQWDMLQRFLGPFIFAPTLRKFVRRLPKERLRFCLLLKAHVPCTVEPEKIAWQCCTLFTRSVCASTAFVVQHVRCSAMVSANVVQKLAQRPLAFR